MKNIQAMAGGSVGYVRGVFSGRAQGVAFPVDLVRVVARAAARLGVRRRMAQAFGGYLVSDTGPAVVPMFSARRDWHLFGFNAYAATSSRWPLGLRGDFPHAFGGRGVVAGGPLDAPDEIAAGSVVSCMGEPHGRLMLRGEEYSRLAGRRSSGRRIAAGLGMSAAGVAVATEKNRNECGGSCGSDKEILVECGETEGLQGPGEDSFVGGAGSCTERKRNGTEAAPGRKENVTVSDWLDRTRRALDQLQGVK